MAKYFLDSILLRIFNMADLRYVLVQMTVNVPLVRVKLLRAINRNPDCTCTRIRVYVNAALICPCMDDIKHFRECWPVYFVKLLDVGCNASWSRSASGHIFDVTSGVDQSLVGGKLTQFTRELRSPARHNTRPVDDHAPTATRTHSRRLTVIATHQQVHLNTFRNFLPFIDNPIYLIPLG